MMTPHKDESATNFDFTLHHLNAGIVGHQHYVSSISNELKSAIAVEVQAQIIPVVKEIVREVVKEVRTVVSDMVTPLYDEIRTVRNQSTISDYLLYSTGNTGISVNRSFTAANHSAQESGAGNCDMKPESSVLVNNSKIYRENNFSTKSQDEFIREPKEPRAQTSTSDCAAFSFIYYNTACLIPIPTLLDPKNNAFVCRKVPKIFLGKEGGKISFLVDMKSVKLRDLTSDNLGYWTSRFAAHMKTRKFFVKDGQITGRIQQFGQICHLLQDYDYILHRQYYCHGNTIGPSAIRKNIWYLTNKVNGGQVVGCALISYEIGDNATVKISKLRHKPEVNMIEVKEKISTEEMVVNNVEMNTNAELQRLVDSLKPL